ncbi:MAG: threonine-phosphate decarboxylase [Clostridia bacterium]|nr:threonine-phosphate decarboxylase [Clostridia bacterium]NCC44617.1 threonine-phosphate decarboxylase [Clostridia bacterium]
MKKYIHGGDIYRHPDALDFSANINPLGTPLSVVEAAQKSMFDISHYPDAYQEKLKTALAQYEDVPEEWLICGNGAAELIFTLVQAIRPQKAFILAPTFAEYEQALRGVDCEIYYETLKKENNFQLEENFVEKLNPEIDILFLCNPNNPTGLLIDHDLLERIVRRCQQERIWLVVDECFIDFVSEPEKETLKNMISTCDNLFILKAFTKRYAMAGLRLGYGITAQRSLMNAMEQRMQPWNVSIPAQEAGTAALKESAYVDRARKIVDEEKKYLKQELTTLGYTVYDSRANYIFFFGKASLRDDLLKENILIRDCSNYPGLSEGYFRIAVRTHEENEKLVAAMWKVRKR